MSAKHVEFKSAFPLVESVDRLKATTRRWTFSLSAMAHESPVGRVSSQRVALQRVIPMFGNSFKPFFIRQFVEREGRVFLVGRFRMLWFVRIFFTFWLAAVAVATLSMAVLSNTSPLRRSHDLMFGAIMLAAALALFGFGRWLSRNDPAWLSQVIQNALSAEKSGSPAIPRGRFERTQIIGAVCLVLALLCWTPFVDHGKVIHVAGPYPALMRAMTAINGAILLFIGYGAFRKQLFAWRLGLAFIALMWLESVLPLRWGQNFSSTPLVIRIVFIIGLLIVTFMWGWWWYAQREYWPSTDARRGAP